MLLVVVRVSGGAFVVGLVCTVQYVLYAATNFSSRTDENVEKFSAMRVSSYDYVHKYHTTTPTRYGSRRYE